jgi:hypothetical protein
LRGEGGSGISFRYPFAGRRGGREVKVFSLGRGPATRSS